MHICYVALDFHQKNNGGGIASYVQTVAKELIARGHHVSVIAKGNQKEWSEADGVQVLFWPLGNLHWYLSKVPLGKYMTLPMRELEWSYDIWRAAQEVQNHSPVDVFECCETGNLFIHTLKVPFVVRLHGEPYVFTKYSGLPLHFGLKLYRKMGLRTLNRATMVTSPSRFQAKEAATDLSWDEKRIEVVPNPISSSILKNSNPDISCSDHSEKPIGWEGKSLVLYSGRIEYVKGIIHLVQSVKQVVNGFTDAHFVIAGVIHNPKLEKELDGILCDEVIRSHVSFLGHVQWDDLAQLYKQASVFVMPSYYETFGISVLEAMAFGLPVIATTAGGLPEVVENEVTGILVPPRDHIALGNAIIRLLKDSDMRFRMGQAGRKRVMEHFTAHQVADQTLSKYRKILGK